MILKTLRNFQRAAALRCMGADTVYNRQERGLRFLEEAIELVQAVGIMRSDVREMVDHVYDKPVGSVRSEIAGSMITLAVLADALGYDLQDASMEELARIEREIGVIRERHFKKKLRADKEPEPEPEPEPLLRKLDFKGVSYNLQAIPRNFNWEARCLDAPDSPIGTGPNSQAALTDCEVKLSRWLGVEEKSEHQLAVEKMMRLITKASGRKQPGQWIPEGVLWEMDEPGRLLRATLILEEVVKELIGEGLGFDLVNGSLVPNGKFDLLKVIDGCFDARVVITGTLSCFGVPDLRGQRLVDQNNLDKFGPGSWIRDDGKLMKPPGHKPPDLESFLRSLEINHGNAQAATSVSGESSLGNPTGRLD